MSRIVPAFQLDPLSCERDELAQAIKYLLFLLMDLQENWRTDRLNPNWANGRFAALLGIGKDAWEDIRAKIDRGEPHKLRMKSLTAIFRCDQFPEELRGLAGQCWLCNWTLSLRGAGLFDDDARQMVQLPNFVGLAASH